MFLRVCGRIDLRYKEPLLSPLNRALKVSETTSSLHLPVALRLRSVKIEARRSASSGFRFKGTLIETYKSDLEIQTEKDAIDELFKLTFQELKGLKTASGETRLISLMYILKAKELLEKVFFSDGHQGFAQLLESRIFADEASSPIQAELAELTMRFAVQFTVFKTWDDFGPLFQGLLKQLILGKPYHVVESIFQDFFKQIEEHHTYQARQIVAQVYKQCFPNAESDTSLALKLLNSEQISSTNLPGEALLKSIYKAIASHEFNDYKEAMEKYFSGKRIRLSRDLYLQLIQLCSTRLDFSYVVMLFNHLIEETYLPTLQASHTGLRACGRLAGLSFNVLYSNPVSFAHQVRRITSVVPHTFPVLMACFAQLGSGQKDLTVLELKRFHSDLKASNASTESFNALISAFGALGELGEMYKILMTMPCPNELSLLNNLHFHIYGRMSEQAIAQIKSPQMSHISPGPRTYAVIMSAASQLRRLPMMKEYWHKCTLSGDSLPMFCYVKAVTAFKDFLHPVASKNTALEERKDAINSVDLILAHMQAHSSDPGWEVYEVALKAHANYLMLHKASHLPMLKCYAKFIAGQPSFINSQVYAFMLSALANCVSLKGIAHQISSDVSLLSADVDRLGVKPSCSLFEGLIRISGMINMSQLDLFYHRFLEFAKSEHDSAKLIDPFNAYLRFCHPSPTKFHSILAQMDRLAVLPNHKTFMHIFQRFLKIQPQPKHVWELLFLLKKYSDPNGTRIMIFSKLIDLILVYFGRSSNVTELDKVGDYIFDLLDPTTTCKKTYVNFYISIILQLTGPTVHAIDDSLPILAKWLTRLLNAETCPYARARALEPLWAHAKSKLPNTSKQCISKSLDSMLNYSLNCKYVSPRILLESCRNYRQLRSDNPPS